MRTIEKIQDVSVLTLGLKRSDIETLNGLAILFEEFWEHELAVLRGQFTEEFNLSNT